MKKKVIIPLSIIVAVIVVVIIVSLTPSEKKSVQLLTKVSSGKFEVIIPVTGELKAEKSTQILAPVELRGRNLRLRSLKIQSMVEEGTIVDSGQWVASLDRSEADNSYKDVLNYLDEHQSAYTKVVLDTTIQLRQLRNDLINLKFNMEEMEIALEQSMYEPPATIRQVQMNLDKAKRSYQQALTNYDLKVIQANASIKEAWIDLQRAKQTVSDMDIAIQNFDIKAPAPGMVIYAREYSGAKRTVGSEINTWDLIVAELPDLSSMVSRTYVNEIDISKIRKGQSVRIGVDAFPEKNYTGEVLSIGNIGQQLPYADAKVFEVLIKIFERDSILRPSMTTSNKIITKEYNDVLFIPLESIHSNDSIPFVYTKNGHRQVVLLGEPNENMIIVEKGLTEGQEIYLSVPEEAEKFQWEGLELANIIKQKEAEKARLIKEMNDSLKKSIDRGDSDSTSAQQSGESVPGRVERSEGDGSRTGPQSQGGQQRVERSEGEGSRTGRQSQGGQR